LPCDRVGGLVNVLTGEQRDPGVEGAIVADGFRDFQATRSAEVEVVLAVAGGDVDEAGAGLGGNEVGQQQGCVLVVAASTQGVGHDGTGEFGALNRGQDGVGGNAGIFQDRWQ
jgi:hypothetical protein